MKAVRYLILTFALLGFQAHANDTFQNNDEPQFDLTDVLTPEELIYEFGITQKMIFDSMMWMSSFENPRLHIVINKAEKGTAVDAQTLEAYVDGVLIHKFKVTTGAETPKQKPNGKWANRRTPTGTFRIIHRSRNHVSSAWEGARMPFAQFFTDYGIAMHATVGEANIQALGRRGSGGCIRLHPDNAKIMWDLVGSLGVKETIVMVYDGSQTPHPLGQAGGGQPLIPETSPTTPKPKPAPAPAPRTYQPLTEEEKAANQANEQLLERIKKQQREYQEALRKHEEEVRKYEEDMRKYNEEMQRRKNLI
jgi:hypothetical protein